MSDELEWIWDRLLSRKPGLVRAAFAELNTDEQRAVLTHLERMTGEPGWQPSQRESAQEALDILNSEGRKR